MKSQIKLINPKKLEGEQLTRWNQVLENVADIVVDKLAVDKEEARNLKYNFHDDLGADSLDKVEIGYACERDFGVAISDEVLENINSTHQMASYLFAQPELKIK